MTAMSPPIELKTHLVDKLTVKTAIKYIITQTLMTPLGCSGSSHWTTTVLELTGRARTFTGGLPGTVTCNT